MHTNTQTRWLLEAVNTSSLQKGAPFFCCRLLATGKMEGVGWVGCEVRAPSWSYTLTSCKQLYCRVYVECVSVPQRLPQSDSKEVGQQRDPVQPELSRSCVCVCVCWFFKGSLRVSSPKFRRKTVTHLCLVSSYADSQPWKKCSALLLKQKCQYHKNTLQGKVMHLKSSWRSADVLKDEWASTANTISWIVWISLHTVIEFSPENPNEGVRSIRRFTR